MTTNNSVLKSIASVIDCQRRILDMLTGSECVCPVLMAEAKERLQWADKSLMQAVRTNWEQHRR